MSQRLKELPLGSDNYCRGEQPLVALGSLDAPYRLPMACQPYEDESLVGLLVRNAAVHGFTNPMDLFWRLELPRKTDIMKLCYAPPASRLGRALKEALGLSDDLFNELTPRSDRSGYVSVLGVLPPGQTLHRWTRSYCPLCLQDAPYHRASWLIRLLPACPKHNVRLFERCPNPSCRHLLNWRYGSVLRCDRVSCRSDLRNAPAKLVPSIYTKSIESICEALTGKLAKTEVVAPRNCPSELVILAQELGSLLVGLRSSGELAQSDEMSALEVMHEGWKAVSDWPNGFDRFLGEVARCGQPRTRMDFGRSYGDIWNLIDGWRGKPWGSDFLEIFLNHVEASTGVNRQSATMARWLLTEL